MHISCFLSQAGKQAQGHCCKHPDTRIPTTILTPIHMMEYHWTVTTKPPAAVLTTSRQMLAAASQRCEHCDDQRYHDDHFASCTLPLPRLRFTMMPQVNLTLLCVCPAPHILSPCVQVTRARVSVNSAYQDPVFQNPNGWRVGAKVNSTVIIASPTGGALQVYNQDRADSKLAPAIAIAGTNTLSAVPTTSYTQAEAYARPGLQYGVTFAQADQHMQNLGECPPCDKQVKVSCFHC